jgi:hypothetical protein
LRAGAIAFRFEAPAGLDLVLVLALLLSVVRADSVEVSSITVDSIRLPRTDELDWALFARGVALFDVERFDGAGAERASALGAPCLDVRTSGAVGAFIGGFVGFVVRDAAELFDAACLELELVAGVRFRVLEVGSRGVFSAARRAGDDDNDDDGVGEDGGDAKAANENDAAADDDDDDDEVDDFDDDDDADADAGADPR